MSSTPAPPPQDEGRGRKAGQRHCELRAMTRIAPGFDDQQLSPSSSRKRGPITTGLSCFFDGGGSSLLNNIRLWLWVLAFARTTGRELCSETERSILAAPGVRAFHPTRPHRIERAQGRPGACMHPWSACNKKARGRTTGTGGSTGLPCAMVLRLIRNLPGDRAFLPPSSA